MQLKFPRFGKYSLLMIMLAMYGCNHQPHWEIVGEFGSNGKFVVLPTDTEINWNALLNDESLWRNGTSADTTHPGSNSQLVVQFTFNVKDINDIDAALLRLRHNMAFRAYLNGKEFLTRRQNRFIADYQDPWKQSNRHPIYAFYRPINLIVEEDHLISLLSPGENTLHIVFSSDEKFRLKHMNDISFSLGINKAATIYSAKQPQLKPDAYFTTSELPVLTVETNGRSIPDEPKIPIVLSVYAPGQQLDDEPSKLFEAGIELRGNTAQIMSKKSFGLKLDDPGDADFLGMPAEKKWVLYGPYLDRTLVRNAFAYSLFRKMGHYSVRFRFCELFIDQQYQGIYMVSEKIEFEKDRITGNRAEKNNPDAIDEEGDFLLEIDRGKKTGWKSDYGHDENKGQHYFEFEDPKAEDLNDHQISHVKNFIDAFEQFMQSDSIQDIPEAYQRYINTSTFIDYIILNELSKNIDAYRLSTFLVKRGVENGGKLEAGPAWDYNLSFGLPDYKQGFLSSGFIYNASDTNLPFWWKALMQNPHFNQRVKDRYRELRSTILQRDSLHQTWQELIAQVEPAVDRNFEKWTVLTDKYFWPNYQGAKSYKEACNQVEEWLDERLVWLDEQWLNDDPL